MTFITTKSEYNVKEIKQGDKLWHIYNGLTVTPRAGFQISDKCPYEYRAILRECIHHGWIKPIAYMRDDEYAWESLKE